MLYSIWALTEFNHKGMCIQIMLNLNKVRNQQSKIFLFEKNNKVLELEIQKVGRILK
jgi:hypothetical protein